MKKIFSTIALVSASIFGYGQQYSEVPFTIADTLINADTIVKDIQLSASADAVILQPVFTRLSGTAAGKLFISQSVNGVNYVVTDSVILANVAVNTALISKTSPLATYYRFEFISSGTTALIPRLFYYQRKFK